MYVLLTYNNVDNSKVNSEVRYLSKWEADEVLKDVSHYRTDNGVIYWSTVPHIAESTKFILIPIDKEIVATYSRQE